MVAGMRFGGGEVKVDYNKDGNAYDSSVDRTVKSAYVVMDITNPEAPPRVLAELTFDDLGYTTCYPTVMAMQPTASNNNQAASNRWTLVFGSGPNENGHAGIGDSLKEASSNTKGKVFMVDLKELAINQEIWTVDGSTALRPLRKGQYVYDDQVSANAFVSDIISVDYDLDYFADALYFGTVSGSKTLGWGGQLRRIELFDDPDSTKWKNSILIDLSDLSLPNHQPITAAPTIGLDKANNKWVFFGTGRFFVNSDIQNKELQSYYGIKDTWGTVSRANLLDVTSAKVFNDKSVTGVAGVTDFAGVETKIDTKPGWLLNLVDANGLAVGHRNLGQAALLGEILTFTSYLPSSNICQTEGSSELYACYYRTGTAYEKAVIGATWIDSNSDGKIQANELQLTRRTAIGSGMALSPNLHTGREDGANVFIQTSKGGISIFEEDSPGLTKSAKSYWRQR